MYLTYRPVGGTDVETPEVQEFVFIPGKTSTFDSEAIESATGWTWDEFLMNLQKGSIKARRTLLWVMLRRNHRGLQLRDVHFTNDEVTLEHDAMELEEMKRNFEDQPDRVGVDKAAVLAQMDIEIAKARPAPSDSGKAPELISGDVTGLPLHKSALAQ